MVSNENHNRQADRRRDILVAAEKIFGVKGYSGASIDEIAVEAGISKGSVYNYFKSKNDLFMQLFSAGVEDFRVGIEQVINKKKSAHDKLDELVNLSFARVTMRDKKLGRLALEFWVGAIRQGQSGRIFQVFDELYSWYHGVIVEILQFGQRQGEFNLEHEAEILATLLLAVMDGLWLQSLLGVVKNIGADHLEALRLTIFKTISKEIVPDS